MRIAIYTTCGLLCAATTIMSTTTSIYNTEIKQQLTSVSSGESFCPQNSLEKVFFDVFSYATMPYSQPIRRLTIEACPQLHELLCKISMEQGIEKPQLFLACDQSPNNIDIKVCTFNTASAILLHPGTVASLSTRVFERYIEQAICRIQATIFQFSQHLKAHSAQKTGFILTLPLITAATAGLTYYCAKQEGHEKYLVPFACGISSSIYAVLFYRWLTKKYVGFSFQRISSFHNSEQAREDFFPALSRNKKPQFTPNPNELFGIEAIMRTQNYLKTRNDEFRELEKMEN